MLSGGNNARTGGCRNHSPLSAHADGGGMSQLALSVHAEHARSLGKACLLSTHHNEEVPEYRQGHSDISGGQPKKLMNKE